MKKLLAIASVSVLALAACGDDDSDISPETLTEALVAQGLERDVAECISSDLSDQLSDEDFTAVAAAETTEEIPAGLQDLVIEVTSACVLGDG